ncbi:MAG: 4a-hydroxytetrahydrobiopterin dehydratase [Verrucomicrobiota bacterium]
MKRLTPKEVRTATAAVPLWNRSGKVLTRTFTLTDFRAALALVNAVGRLAEKAGHHPDISISWNRVRLDLTTHDAGGLTALDFALAAKIDALAARRT